MFVIFLMYGLIDKIKLNQSDNFDFFRASQCETNYIRNRFCMNNRIECRCDSLKFFPIAPFRFKSRFRTG